MASVICLLTNNDFFSIPDDCGRTALMFATMNRCKEVFDFILLKTPQEARNAQTPQGYNALYIACYCKNADRVQSLLDNGVEVVQAYPPPSFPHELVSGLDSNQVRIRKLLGQRYMRAQGIFLTRMLFYLKHQENYDAAVKEAERWKKARFSKDDYERVKGTVKLMEEHSINPREVVEQNMKTFLESENIRLKMICVLTCRPLLVTNSSHAVEILEDSFGFAPSRKYVKQLLKTVEYKTARELLYDKRHEIFAHFGHHRPESLEAAMQYIKDKYECECSVEKMKVFLRRCAEKFSWEAPPVLDT
jgi:ankyrin repeat protein